MAQTGDINLALEQIWQKMPDEERVLMLAQAKASGIEACAIFSMLAAAVSLSLHIPWMLIAAACCLPLMYQVMSRRAWMHIKPITVVQYFLASISTQFFAESLRSKNPSLKLIFRGLLHPVPLEGKNSDSEDGELEHAESIPTSKDVWVSLFPDSLVMISEGESGADLIFGHSTLHDFEVEVDSPEDARGSRLATRLLIQTSKDNQVTSRWILTSPHTETLLACERSIRFFNQRASGL